MASDALYGAIEGGGTKFLCAIGRGPSDIVELARIDTTTPAETLAKVRDFLAPQRARLQGLGICCFGPLELDARAPAFGSLLDTPKPGWSHAPVHKVLRDALELPTAIDTDVNGAALAEQRWGAARDLDPVVYVTVGTGVGVGVVIDGRPLHGLVHPELGHMPARDEGAKGVCPFHGACVEGLVSAPALRARAGTDPASLADDHPLWDSAARTLADLVQTIVLAYSPRRIVLGGGVLSRASLLPKIQRALLAGLHGYLPRQELSAQNITSYVVAAQLGALAGLAGAFALAQDAAASSK